LSFHFGQDFTPTFCTFFSQGFCDSCAKKLREDLSAPNLDLRIILIKKPTPEKYFKEGYNMKKQILSFVIMLSLSLAIAFSASAIKPKIAFIFMGDDGPFTKPALDFASKTFDTTVLDRQGLTKTDLKKFSVVWWHEGDSDPGALTDQEIKAFMDYAKSGGEVLLTAWAIRYATPMGLEAAEARQFGPEPDDGISVGLTLLKEMMDLPLWKGLKNIDGDPPQAGDRVQVNSTGYPKSGDYYSNLWKNFVTVAHVWGPPANDWGDQIAAFGYWEAGKGKVFNMNWRIPNFHANNKDIEMLQKLTENVINWLSTESLYSAVSHLDKLPSTWGDIKQ